MVEDPETVARYHAAMRAETDRLSALIDDLFELSRAQAGVAAAAAGAGRRWAIWCPTRSPGSLRSLRPRACGSRAGSTGRRPRSVASTPEVVRALRNVLENAIRHTPTDGSVMVEAGAAEPGHAFVSVIDSAAEASPSRPRPHLRHRVPDRIRRAPRAARASGSPSPAASSRPTAAGSRCGTTNGARGSRCNCRWIRSHEGAGDRRRRVHRSVTSSTRCARPATRWWCSTGTPAAGGAADPSADVTRPDAMTRARGRSRRGLSSGGQGRSRRGLRRRAGLRRRQRPRYRGPAAGPARRRLPRAARARVEHGRVRRGPVPVRDARRRAGAASPPGGSRRGPLRAGLSRMRGTTDAGVGPRDRAARSPERVRGVEGRAGASGQRVRAGAHGRDGHGAAVPQRLRARDAPRHALRGSRRDLHRRARLGDGATRVRGRRADP